jgi:hypothetical protein
MVISGWLKLDPEQWVAFFRKSGERVKQCANEAGISLQDGARSSNSLSMLPKCAAAPIESMTTAQTIKMLWSGLVSVVLDGRPSVDRAIWVGNASRMCVAIFNSPS